jgi:hypothetical protein
MQAVAQIFAHAKKEGYDWLPVRNEDGIHHIVETRRLEHIATWGEVKDQGRKVTVDDLVARDAPVLSILERLEKRGFLLCLGRNGIDGIVTVYDVNQPAAHHLGFALAIVIENEVAGAIEAALGDRALDEESVAALAEEAEVRPENTRRWVRAKQSSTQLSFARSLSFGDKLKLLKKHGLARLASSCSWPSDELLDGLWDAKKLRDAVAHEKAELLEDHRQMRRLLSKAHQLAHALTGQRVPTD